jgi:uncharacterized DUF497 family protein
LEHHWNDNKDAELQEQRDVSFHTIEHEIRDDHIWAVPFVVQDEENVFLKTAYPSRKYTRLYGGTE